MAEIVYGVMLGAGWFGWLLWLKAESRRRWYEDYCRELIKGNRQYAEAVRELSDNLYNRAAATEGKEQ